MSEPIVEGEPAAGPVPVRRGSSRGWAALAADPRALARILDEAPYPAWIQSLDEPGLRCVAINDACAAAYGYTSVELLGTHACDTMPPDDFASYEATVREVVATRSPVTRRFHATSDEGESVYDMVVTPLFDDHGEVHEVFGVSRDVTDDTESLRSSTERWSAVFRSSHDAVVLFTGEGVCVDANPAAERLFLLDASALVGRDLKEFVDHGAEELAHLEELGPGHSVVDTVEMRRADGTARVVEYHVETGVQPGLHLAMVRDVTDELAAAASLQESEQRFRLLADSAPALIWTTGADGKATTFNRVWLDFRGRSLADEITGGLFAGVHPDDRERCMTILQTAIATQTACSMTHRLRRGDGTDRWLLTRASPRLRADGRYQGHIGASVDVTDQVEAEAALRAERDHMQALTASLQDALLESDSLGRILGANQRFTELTGFDADEVIGAEVPYAWWPEDWHERLGEAALEALAVGHNEIDCEFLRRDGSRFPVAVSVSTVCDENGVTGLVGTVRDMTGREEAAAALRRSEERFRALVEGAPDMIAILDGDGRLLEASPSAGVTLGLETDDFLGQRIFDFVHPDDQAQLIASFTEALGRPGVGDTVEFRLAASDGSWRMIQAVGRNLLDDPAVEGFVVNARDITERSRLEEELAKSQRLEAVGRLAGGIAHDFNNILTAISGYAEMLLADVPDTFEHRDDLEELARAADRASALVEQLLAFARKQSIEPTLFDVHAVIRSMEVMLRRLLGPAVGLAVGGPPIAASIRADRSQMEQVILNLVVNARDACSAAGGQIVVRTDVVDLPAADRDDPADLDPGRYVVVSVRDDGTGMDPTTQAQAFEPFFTTKEDKGTGLGLSIVYGIVSQSGGRLHFESEPGQGTTVRVYLPYVAEVDHPLAPATTPTPLPAPLDRPVVGEPAP